MKAFCLVMVGSISTCVAAVAAAPATLDDGFPNVDTRRALQKQTDAPDATRAAAVARLKARIPEVKVDFDDLLATPKFIRSTKGLLAEPEPDPTDWPPLPPGLTPPPKPDTSDRNRALKRFLNENAELFGHDASVLNSARVTREFTTAYNHVRTVVWQQERDGIPLFECAMIANFARGDVLASLSSQLLPEPARATASGNIIVTAAEAIARAARSIGEERAETAMFPARIDSQGNDQRQKFTGEVVSGEAEASLVWLPWIGRV